MAQQGESGIVSPQNPTGQIYAIGNQGTQPTAAQSAANSNPNPTPDQIAQNQKLVEKQNQLNPGSGVSPSTTGGGAAVNESLGANYTPPQTEDQIRQQMLQQSQQQIDAINAQFAATIEQDQYAAKNAQTDVNASASRMGLMGSPTGGAMLSEQAQRSNTVIAKDQAAQQAALSAVYDSVNKNALAQANYEKEQAVSDANTFAKNQQAVAATAQAQVAQLAKLGITTNSIQANDPELWATLQKQTGYSDYQLQVSLDNDPNNPNAKQTTQTYAADPNDPNKTIVRRITIDPSTGKSTENDYSLDLPYNKASPNAFKVVGSNLYYTDPTTGDLKLTNPYKAAAQGATVYNTNTGETQDSDWGLGDEVAAPSGTTDTSNTSGMDAMGSLPTTYATSTGNNPMNVMADSSGSELTKKAEAAGATTASFTDAQGNKRTAFVFPDLATGTQFGKDTFNTTYKNSTVQDALSSWSGGAYSADLAKAAGVDPMAKVSDLPKSQQDSLFAAMIKREGGQTIADSNKKTATQVSTSANVPAWAKDSGLTVSDLKTLKGINGMSPEAALVVGGIMYGSQPPVTTGLFRNSLAVRAGLASLGFPMAKAQEDWQAMNTRLKTMNSTGMVRLQQAVTFAYDSLDVIDKLNKAWSGSDFPALNKTALEAAKAGVTKRDLAQPIDITTAGKDGTMQNLHITNSQELATALDGQISDLVSELGTVYKGGGTNTDSSLFLASKNLSGDWSEDTLNVAVNQARTNLQIRKNSIATSSAIPGNPYSYAASDSTSGSTDLSGTTFNGLTATLPDGSSATFPDQASLDQFMQDNGL